MSVAYEASPTSQTGWTASRATHYMMAGAHLDEEFAAQAIDEVLLEDRRAVAPSYGYDAVPVLHECLRAQARRFLRDAVVCFLFFVCLFFATPLILTWMLSAIGWLFARGIVGWWQRFRDRNWSNTTIWWRTLAVYVLFTGLPLTLFVGLFLIGLAASSGGDSFYETDSSALDEFFSLIAFSSFLLWLLITAAIFGEAILRWQSLRDLGTRRRASRERSAKGFTKAFEERVLKRFATRLHQVGEAQYGNVTIYRGFQPFVGSGAHVYTWSMALELKNDDGTPATHGFTPQDLYHRVTEGVELLRNVAPAQGQPIQALEIVDRFFVAGDALHAHPETRQLHQDTRQPPSQYLDPASSQRLVNAPPERVRHYRCFRIDGWQGELVTTIFLHAAREGRMLYLEFDRYVLLPVKPRYYLVDWFAKAPTRSFFSVLWAAARFWALAPIYAFASLYRTVRVVMQRAVEHVIGDGFGLERPAASDFGAAVGVRDLAAHPDFDNYFQLLDSDKYFSMVERRVLETVGTFLRECGISTEEFAERRTTILNNNIQVHGGIFQGATSIGHSSQAAQAGRVVPEKGK